MATCRPKTCSRTVPDGESCHMVDDYCTRPIYKLRCDYRTQEWQTISTTPVSGSGPDITWADITPGPLQRLLYKADYTIIVSYRDLGKAKTHTFNPEDTTTLGMSSLVSRASVESWDRDYKTWIVGRSVMLKINNLGGIHSVK